MATRGPRLTFFALCAFAASCGPEDAELGAADVQTSDQELVGGTSTSLRPEVGTFRGCTATLVHERYVLAAAHCLNYPDYTDITVRSTDTFNTGTNSYPVDKIHSFAFGRYHYTQSGDRVTDVALIRLTTAVPASVATPAPIAERMPNRGERVTIFGFGCRNRSTGVGGGKQYFEFDYGTSTQALCPGDSGGPVFLGHRSSGGALWGVNSDYAGSWSFSSWNDIFGDVTGLKIQIEATIRQWEGGDGLEPGFDRPGGDFRSFWVYSNNVEACRTACNGDSRCHAFTYREQGTNGSPYGYCWLKDWQPGMRPLSGFISGTAFRVYENNIDRPGNDYRSFLTSSSYTCQRTCAEEARCAAFTHNSGRCWLKTEEGVPRRLTGSISGKKRGLEMNTDRYGADYRSFTPSTQDPEHCQSACRRESACRSWTYVPPSGNGAPRCHLKNATPGTYSTLGMTSGYRLAFLSYIVWVDDEPNTDRYGGDYRSFWTSSAATCKATCQAESVCRAWTWIPARNGTGAWCALKNTIPSARNTTNMVSGRKYYEMYPEPTF